MLIKKKIKKNNKGFSLAEVLTTLAIIIIIALVTAPAMKQYFNNLQLNNSAKYLISNLRLAQQYTVTQQKKHAIRMELWNNTYYLVKKEPVEEILQTFSLKNGTIFSSFSGLQNNEAVYNASGAVDYSGEVYLEHQASGHQTKILIKPSGYVTWEVYNP
ncbi:prepilin-type N-terminal cleavage/methylation domain-containing protein [Patescibacteria group bacterium]|nr:prepilin-type N-terminal cleavage/methylation domain-containing protein [Patescibacteria group bacterium]